MTFRLQMTDFEFQAFGVASWRIIYIVQRWNEAWQMPVQKPALCSRLCKYVHIMQYLNQQRLWAKSRLYAYHIKQTMRAYRSNHPFPLCIYDPTSINYLLIYLSIQRRSSIPSRYNRYWTIDCNWIRIMICTNDANYVDLVDDTCNLFLAGNCWLVSSMVHLLSMASSIPIEIIIIHPLLMILSNGCNKQLGDYLSNILLSLMPDRHWQSVIGDIIQYSNLANIMSEVCFIIYYQVLDID